MHEPVTATQIAQLEAGVELMGENDLLRAHLCKLEDSHILSFTIHQGIYHQVKRMIAAVGNHVDALHLEQNGQFGLGEVAEGQWVYLDCEQQQSEKQTPEVD
jgi:16S rRNA pseudouridine516 synthase